MTCIQSSRKVGILLLRGLYGSSPYSVCELLTKFEATKKSKGSKQGEPAVRAAVGQSQGKPANLESGIEKLRSELAD